MEHAMLTERELSDGSKVYSVAVERVEIHCDSLKTAFDLEQHLNGLIAEGRIVSIDKSDLWD